MSKDWGSKKEIKQKLEDYCLLSGITLHDFFEYANVHPLIWYKFLNGRIPQFRHVAKIVKASKNHVTFDDFALSIKDKIENIG